MSRLNHESLDGNAYHAAGLFNLPDRYFNEALVNAVEAAGPKVFSPQRDGVEFTLLAKALEKHFSPQKIDSVVRTIIYCFDVKKISESDVVLARYDEPPDPGVITEILIANALGIPVIVYRTDDRSPYGSMAEIFQGIHTFPVDTSQVLILHPGGKSPQADLEDLTGRILTELKPILDKSKSKRKKSIPDFLKPTFTAIEKLYSGIDDYHSEASLAKVAGRYKKYAAELDAFGPLVWKKSI